MLSVSLELVNDARVIVTWNVSIRLGEGLVQPDRVFLARLNDDNALGIFDIGDDCGRQAYVQSMGNKIKCNKY